MRILVFSAYYRPDGGPGAPLITMLSEELVRSGHEMTVVTAVPHYPSGNVPTEHRSWLPRETVENGVRVVRVPLPSLDRRRLGLRLVQFAVYQLWAFLAALRYSFDVVVAHSPALEVWLPFAFHAVLRNKPSVYSVHDVYPDVGVKLNVFKSKLVIGLVTWLEKVCLNRSSMVRVLSDSFGPRLLSFGVPESKVRLIYDWVEVDDLKPLSRENSFSEEFGLTRTFNIVYAGNIGVVQGLETALDAAELLRESDRLKFVFIGDGTARADLTQAVERRGLSNVVFLPYQPRERMGEIWASSDAGLVMLRKGTGFGALPSKTLSILASGRPVLASVDEGSDTWKLVERSRSGVCVSPGSPQLLVEAVLKLMKDDDLRNACSQNGRDYVVQHHSPQAAAKYFEQLFNDAISARNASSGESRVI